MAICDPVRCSGCAACANVCPVSCIAFESDAEGFLRPQIDDSRCVHCHLCENRCPVNNLADSIPEVRPRAVYAAKARDLSTRLVSSSGGVFSLLAKQVIAKGGVVYGVGWDFLNYGARFISARTEDELIALRGSKYVQAVPGSVFRDAQAVLGTGKPVLFSGIPCQVAALRSVLGKTYDNLLTVETVCHSVPSPFAFRCYLEEKERLAESRVVAINCRAKRPSWTRYEIEIQFEKESVTYRRPSYRDPYLRGFVRGVYARPSCAQCSFKNFRSGADIILGDYWGIKKVMPALYDDRGTSAVLVNTERGASAFSEIASDLHFAQSTFEDVVRFNPALVKSTSPSKYRARFFAKLPKSRSFTRLVMPLSRFPVRFWVFLFLSTAKRKFVKILNAHLSTLN